MEKLTKDDKALVGETKALIGEVEVGETTHAAWVAIQDRVKHLYEGRTQKEVGELLGKGEAWVASVVKWDPRHGGDSPRSNVAANRSGATEAARSARKILREAPIEEVEKIAMDLPPERRKAVTEALINSHPARTRPGTPLPPAKRYGFTWEMMGPKGKLLAAIKAYIEAWEQAAPEATEEELEVERDLLAPDLQSLRLTIEGINA